MSGLEERYLVVDTRSGEPVLEPCIVLKFSDPINRVALAAWAESMRGEGYADVFKDVMRLLDKSAPAARGIGWFAGDCAVSCMHKPSDICYPRWLCGKHSIGMKKKHEFIWTIMPATKCQECERKDET